MKAYSTQSRQYNIASSMQSPMTRLGDRVIVGELVDGANEVVGAERGDNSDDAERCDGRVDIHARLLLLVVFLGLVQVGVGGELDGGRPGKMRGEVSARGQDDENSSEADLEVEVQNVGREQHDGRAARESEQAGEVVALAAETGVDVGGVVGGGDDEGRGAEDEQTRTRLGGRHLEARLLELESGGDEAGFDVSVDD